MKNLIWRILHADAFVFDAEMVSLLLKIAEFKGNWMASRSLAPDRLRAVDRTDLIEGVGASLRLEGIKLSDDEVGRIAAGSIDASSLTSDQSIALGFLRLMKEIHASWAALPVTEENIRRMHGILMGAGGRDESPIEASQPGDDDAAVLQDGAPAPLTLEALLESTNLELAEKRLPAAVIIGMFAAVFPTIHPFKDGCGLLSHALTELLLLRHGFGYAPYCPLAGVMEASKELYSVSLRATQRTLRGPEANWNPWIRFFLEALAVQARNLEEKQADERFLLSLPEISSRIIELLSIHGTLSITEAGAFLSVNKFTLRAHFKRLAAEGHLIRIGKGPATRYALAAFPAGRKSGSSSRSI